MESFGGSLETSSCNARAMLERDVVVENSVGFQNYRIGRRSFVMEGCLFVESFGGEFKL